MTRTLSQIHIRELSRQSPYTLTTKPLSEVMTGKLPTRFHIPLKAMPGNPLYTFITSPIHESSQQCLYGLTTNPFRELCRYIPVRFHQNPFRESSRQCLYALTTNPFREL